MLKYGDKVKTIQGDIVAFVTGTCIRGPQHVEYQIAYFAKGERVSVWVQHFEIRPYEDNSKPAGFGNFKEYEQKQLN